MLDISRSIHFDDETEDGKSHELKVLSLDRIKAATSNFSESNKLGEGGFGPVYMVCIMLQVTTSLCIILVLTIINTINHFREHYLVGKK
jgi:hypothetical protein